VCVLWFTSAPGLTGSQPNTARRLFVTLTSRPLKFHADPATTLPRSPPSRWDLSNASTSSPAASAALLLFLPAEEPRCATLRSLHLSAQTEPRLTASQRAICAVSSRLQPAAYQSGSRLLPARTFFVRPPGRPAASARFTLTGFYPARQASTSKAASILTHYNTGTSHFLVAPGDLSI
jgi:hypothetical protein